MLDSILLLLFSLISLVTAITIHEFAHAFVADRLGDPTPGLQGRLSLNPLAHLDRYGSILYLLLLFSPSPIKLGWGKPVQFDPFNLRHPRRDAALISLAGPASNILLATAASLILRFAIMPASVLLPEMLFYILAQGLGYLIVTNISLCVFNLIPIHPLDGFKIVGGILPEEYARQWYELQPYGLIFLIVLILPILGPSPINNIIGPPINFLEHLLLPSAAPLI